MVLWSSMTKGQYKKVQQSGHFCLICTLLCLQLGSKPSQVMICPIPLKKTKKSWGILILFAYHKAHIYHIQPLVRAFCGRVISSVDFQLVGEKSEHKQWQLHSLSTGNFSVERLQSVPHRPLYISKVATFAKFP